MCAKYVEYFFYISPFLSAFYKNEFFPVKSLNSVADPSPPFKSDGIQIIRIHNTGSFIPFLIPLSSNELHGEVCTSVLYVTLCAKNANISKHHLLFPFSCH